MVFLKAIYKSVIVFLVAAVFSFVLLENVGDVLLKEDQAKESNQANQAKDSYESKQAKAPAAIWAAGAWNPRKLKTERTD